MHFAHAAVLLPNIIILLVNTAATVNAAAVAAAPTIRRAVVNIDLSTISNVISSEFVSFSIDPERLLSMRDQSQHVLSTLTGDTKSSYLRIAGSETNEWVHNTEVLVAITRWLRSINLKPIVMLQRDHANTRSLIDTLGAVRRANVTDGIWQLGSVFEPTTDPMTYVDELLALWHIRSALCGRDDKEQVGCWSIIGADVSDRVAPTVEQLYADLSMPLTVAMMHRHEHDGDVAAIPSTVDTLEQPQWLQIQQSDAPTLDHIQRGLLFAHTLGSAAQNGYAAVFQPIHDADLSSATLSYYVALLHKQLLGTRVLHTEQQQLQQQLVDGADNGQTMLYVHCGVDASNGAIAVMGVNMASTGVRMSTSLPANATGSSVLQYILRAEEDGAERLLMNDRLVRPGDALRAARKMRKPNRPASFVMPARSVGFWVFPEAVVSVCAPAARSDEAVTTVHSAEVTMSPSELLLQQLIRESVFPAARTEELLKAPITSSTVDNARHKRQMPFPDGRPAAPVGLQKLFGKFDLVKPKQFQIQPLFNKNKRPIVATQNADNIAAIPPVVSTVYDVYQADPADDLFKSSENVDLPKGDVYFQVGSDTQSPDYVAFDEPAAPKKAGEKLKTHQGIANRLTEEEEDVPDDIALQRYPNQFLEFYPADVSGGRATQNDGDAVRSDGAELWEPRGPYDAHVLPAVHSAASDTNVKIVRAREPTWQENQDNLRKAKHSLDGIYYGNKNTDDVVAVAQPGSRGFLGDRFKKMTGPMSSAEDTFFQTRRRRRRAIVDRSKELDEKSSSSSKAASAAADIENDIVNADAGTNAKATPALSPYQERLIYKMTKIMQELQRLVGHSSSQRADDDAPESVGSRLTALVDDLRDIEGHLQQSRLKKPTGFFGKTDMSNGFFAKQSAKAAAVASSIDALADNIPKRCKALAVSLEEQCIREIGGSSSGNTLTRTRRFPRSLTNDRHHWSGEYDAWNDRRTPMDASPDALQLLADDDPRHNMIYKKGEDQMPLVTAYFVRNMPASGETNGEGREKMTTSPPTSTTTEHVEDISTTNDGNSTGKFPSPRFMVTFTRSMEGLLNVVNDHVAGWWHMMS